MYPKSIRLFVDKLYDWVEDIQDLKISEMCSSFLFYLFIYLIRIILVLLSKTQALSYNCILNVSDKHVNLSGTYSNV